jgi:hypothetical protein
MQDPDQTIPVPQSYNAPGQPQWPTPQPPNGQPPGQFPPPASGWPQVPQSSYPQTRGQQPAPGPYNPAPGQFSSYPPGGYGQPFPPSPQAPRPPQRRGLLLGITGIIVLLILIVGGVLVFSRNSGQKNASTSATTATAQAGQSSTGKNASAGSSAQSSASSDNNGAQAQATAAVATALAQGGGASSTAQALAQAGPPDTVVKSFFTAIQNQDYDTAYKYTDFKNINSGTFHTTSTASDQSLGKLTSYTPGKTTLLPGSNTIKAQVAVMIKRANVPEHSTVAMLVLENGTWKIADGTLWQ